MKDSSPADRRARAWHSARTFAVLCFVSSSISFFGWYFVGTIRVEPWGLAAATTGLLTILTLASRDPPPWASTVIFMACASGVLVAGAVSAGLMADTGRPFEAYAVFKVGAIAVALLAPFPTWLGFVVIAACGVTPVTHFFTLSPELRQAFPTQEPWYTLIYAVTAAALLHHRLRGVELEQTITRVNAEKKAADDRAGLLLALRDLTNTPLQSIEVTALLLEAGKIDQADAARYLESSLKRLRSLSEALAFYQRDVDWARARASFDAVIDLQRRLSAMTGKGPPAEAMTDNSLIG